APGPGRERRDRGRDREGGGEKQPVRRRRRVQHGRSGPVRYDREPADGRQGDGEREVEGEGPAGAQRRSNPPSADRGTEGQPSFGRSAASPFRRDWVPTGFRAKLARARSLRRGP